MPSLTLPPGLRAFFTTRPLPLTPIHPLYTIAIPLLILLLTLLSLAVHSDLNLPMLFSQCHSHSRLSVLSRIPLLGPVSCYVISFLQFATATPYAKHVVAPMVPLLAALTTILHLENARVTPEGPTTSLTKTIPQRILANPTGPLLLANLLPALTWQTLLIPSYLYGTARLLSSGSARPLTIHNTAEVVAIPAAVATGFILPAALWFATNSPWAIAAWLLAPVWVSLLRIAIRRLLAHSEAPVVSGDLAGSWARILSFYVVPILTSIAAHFAMVWAVIRKQDDRGEMARSMSLFLEVEVVWTVVAVVYWAMIEVGWWAGVVVGVGTVVGGPGAGVCAGWIYREVVLGKGMGEERGGREEEEGQGGERRADEETPLLR